MDRRSDVIILGAGIVGVSTALHLQRLGRRVILVDRRAPGEETSSGNAGVIARELFEPAKMSFHPAVIMRALVNREPGLRLPPSFLPAVLPWLWHWRQNSSARAIDGFVNAMAPLARYALAEHNELAGQTSTKTRYRDTGWLRIYRSRKAFARAEELHHHARVRGVEYRVCDIEDAKRLEPDLIAGFHKAVFWPETLSVDSPGGITKALAAAFANFGGTFVTGDAAGLQPAADDRWQIRTDEGLVNAANVVIALGPWSGDLLARLGYRLPFAVMRGYHGHFRPAGTAMLCRPVADMEFGFVLTPVVGGIRLTTGVEFAHRDAQKSPVQLGLCLARARQLFPLGEATDERPWMGSRPCLPDSLPLIGRAPRHAGLWVNTGHGHYGFTLGPVSGRLLSEMICDRRTIVDPTPYDPVRYLGN